MNPIHMNGQKGLTRTEPVDSFPQDQARRMSQINFNDRETILDLIEFTRNSSPGYGITNILDRFIENKRPQQNKLQ